MQPFIWLKSFGVPKCYLYETSNILFPWKKCTYIHMHASPFPFFTIKVFTIIIEIAPLGRYHHYITSITAILTLLYVDKLTFKVSWTCSSVRMLQKFLSF